jgi:hypothetical protein
MEDAGQDQTQENQMENVYKSAGDRWQGTEFRK